MRSPLDVRSSILSRRRPRQTAQCPPVLISLLTNARTLSSPECQPCRRSRQYRPDAFPQEAESGNVARHDHQSRRGVQQAARGIWRPRPTTEWSHRSRRSANGYQRAGTRIPSDVYPPRHSRIQGTKKSPGCSNAQRGTQNRKRTKRDFTCASCCIKRLYVASTGTRRQSAACLL
jgi:hypothetical protein